MKTGCFSPFHIVYMIVITAAIIVSLILLKKYVKEEKWNVWIIRIMAILTFAFALTGRITDSIWEAKNYVYVNNPLEGYEHWTWWMLIPHSFCSLSSIVISLAVLFGKKDNAIVQALYPFGFLGGVVNIVYPDYINTQFIYEPRTWSALAHHVFSMWLCAYLIITKWLKPSARKLHYLPIAICIMMTLGIFEREALRMPEGMNVLRPLVAGAPVLTSWYMMSLGLVLGNTIFVVLWETLHNKKKLKDIFKREPIPEEIAE